MWGVFLPFYSISKVLDLVGLVEFTNAHKS